MAKTIHTGSLFNYEFRAVLDARSNQVKIQQRELGASRYSTKIKMPYNEWLAARNVYGNTFHNIGMPRT